MTKPILIGLDYSLTCPALTICEGDFHIDNCTTYFLTKEKKYQHKFCDSRIIGEPLPDWNHPFERYEKIADYFLAIICKYDPKDISMTLEGYSMGSKGLIFNIAEHTGILKYKLWKQDIPLQILAPTTIKKRATGNGRADKDMMYEYYVKETKLDLKKNLCYAKSKVASPLGDIVDSYFMCKVSQKDHENMENGT